MVTVYRRTNSTSSELVYTAEIVPGWNEDFAALWNEAMDEANLRQVQLRLAMVVAAGFLPLVVGGSFSVNGSSCAIDICWGRKNSG